MPSLTFSHCYAECQCTECQFAQCHYAECDYAMAQFLTVMLNVFMECHCTKCHYAVTWFAIVMLNVVMLNVVAPFGLRRVFCLSGRDIIDR